MDDFLLMVSSLRTLNYPFSVISNSLQGDAIIMIVLLKEIKKEEHLQFYFENVKNVSILIQFKHFGSNLNSAQVHYTILQFLRTSYSKNASDFRCLDFLIINKAF